MFSKILTNVLNEDVVDDEGNTFALTYKGQNPLMIDLVSNYFLCPFHHPIISLRRKSECEPVLCVF